MRTKEYKEAIMDAACASVNRLSIGLAGLALAIGLLSIFIPSSS